MFWTLVTSYEEGHGVLHLVLCSRDVERHNYAAS